MCYRGRFPGLQALGLRVFPERTDSSSDGLATGAGAPEESSCLQWRDRGGFAPPSLYHDGCDSTRRRLNLMPPLSRCQQPIHKTAREAVFLSCVLTKVGLGLKHRHSLFSFGERRLNIVAETKGKSTECRIGR